MDFYIQVSNFILQPTKLLFKCIFCITENVNLHKIEAKYFCILCIDTFVSIKYSVITGKTS